MRSKQKFGLVLTLASVFCLLTAIDGLGQTVATVKTPPAVEGVGAMETVVSPVLPKGRPERHAAHRRARRNAAVRHTCTPVGFRVCRRSAVTFSITGIVTQRANGLLGPFLLTPDSFLS
ncbi:MAG: hypothetical protein M3410_01945 [Acidobacteriota bacterium]|nr:hypothetical protein [Acidobacteriota bacterium]